MNRPTRTMISLIIFTFLLTSCAGAKKENPLDPPERRTDCINPLVWDNLHPSMRAMGRWDRLIESTLSRMVVIITQKTIEVFAYNYLGLPEGINLVNELRELGFGVEPYGDGEYQLSANRDKFAEQPCNKRAEADLSINGLLEPIQLAPFNGSVFVLP